MKMKTENNLIGTSGLFDDCSRLSYITPDKRLFQSKLSDLRSLKKQVEEDKKIEISENSEEDANILLSCECLLDALIYELTMWLQLKNDDPNSAWASLVNAQQMIMSSAHASNLEGVDHGKYLNKLEIIEKVAFPPQTFMSTGMVIEETKCSICDEDYENCDHIMGKAYMGKFCSQVVTKIKEMKEISIVNEPFDKRCRVTRMKEGDHWIDTMTGRIVKED